jgi:hypothetical protein
MGEFMRFTEIYTRIFPGLVFPSVRSVVPAGVDSLPGPLQAYHLLAGSIPSLLNQYLQFTPPDALCEENGYIAFCRDNQRVPVWAYLGRDAKLDDTAVYQQTVANGNFLRFCGSLTDFLDFATIWQFYHGMPLSAEHPEDLESHLDRCPFFHRVVRLSANNSVEVCSAYYFEGGVCCVFRRGEVSYFGFSDKAHVGHVQSSLGIVLAVSR